MVLNCKLHTDQLETEINMINSSSPLNSTSCQLKHKSTFILLYDKDYNCWVVFHAFVVIW